MPVSEATARRAVARWELDGGTVSLTGFCPCRYWSRPVDGILLSRRVFVCWRHRPAWNTAGLEQA